MMRQRYAEDCCCRSDGLTFQGNDDEIVVDTVVMPSTVSKRKCEERDGVTTKV